MHDVTLTGLDGTNPLAFLAALGVLEAATNGRPEARLRWQWEGAWHPVIRSAFGDIGSLVSGLGADRLMCSDDPALELRYDGKRDLKPAPSIFRQFLADLMASAAPDHRRSVDWASAFATDVAVDNNGNTKPTALHFTAGQQQFLQMARELAQEVTVEDLREAVEGPWKYVRPLPVMGWDSTSSRDYALRAKNPSTDGKFGIPGADWLALRGLSCVPTMPVGGRVMTTCCSGGWKDGSFAWPLWTVPLSIPVVRTVLRLDFEHMLGEERRARGIPLTFSSRIRRSDQGGYGAFGPAAVDLA